MIIGDPRLFTEAHFEAQRGVASAPLCELVVHCMELVAQLSRAGLEYRFKGGNSQLILLDTPARFSIDVDIVTTVSKEALTEVVQGIVDDCERFTRCEVRPHKTKPWLPILSFNLFFESRFERPTEPRVILDAVLEPAPYPGVRKRVESGDLYYCDETVELPTVGGLLADKMLCISPKTVGIPLGKNKEAHRLKHVFDVANLFRHSPDHGDVQQALAACLAQENAIQKTEHTFDAVAEDTIAFVSEVLAHDAPPAPGSVDPATYLGEIVTGFATVSEFFFRGHYGWDALRTDCKTVVAAVEASR